MKTARLYQKHFPRNGYGYIYKYTFKNNMKYIGQTTQSLELRDYQHKLGDLVVDSVIRSCLDDGETYLLEILEEVPIAELDNAEIRRIAEENTQYPNGFNFTAGGSVCPELSDEAREKIAKDRSGAGHWAFGKNRIFCPENGKEYDTLTQASLELEIDVSRVWMIANGYRDHTKGYSFVYLSAGHEDADFNRIARAFARDYNLTHPTEEVIKHRQEAGYKVSQSNIGKKHSDEWKSNITKSLEGKICSPNGLAHMIAKNKVSPSFKGHKHTEEQKQRMSEMRKGAGNGMFGKYGKDNPGSKAVVAYSYPDMTELKTYASAAEASADLGVTFQAVSACCREKIKSTLGKYTFRFA